MGELVSCELQQSLKSCEQGATEADVIAFFEEVAVAGVAMVRQRNITNESINQGGDDEL